MGAVPPDARAAELVGAETSEVVVMNSLTVKNLHLMMASFYRPTKERHKILVERGAFPSDQYAVTSQIRFHGFDPASSLLELAPRDGESCMRDEDFESLIDREGSSIALILLGGVNYATGQVFDMAAIAKKQGSERDAWLDLIWPTLPEIFPCTCTIGVLTSRCGAVTNI